MSKETKPTILAVGDGSKRAKLRDAIAELMKQDLEQKQIEHEEKEQDEEER